MRWISATTAAWIAAASLCSLIRAQDRTELLDQPPEAAQPAATQPAADQLAAAQRAASAAAEAARRSREEFLKLSERHDVSPLELDEFAAFVTELEQRAARGQEQTEQLARESRQRQQGTQSSAKQRVESSRQQSDPSQSSREDSTPEGTEGRRNSKATAACESGGDRTESRGARALREAAERAAKHPGGAGQPTAIPERAMTREERIAKLERQSEVIGKSFADMLRKSRAGLPSSPGSPDTGHPGGGASGGDPTGAAGQPGDPNAGERPGAGRVATSKPGEAPGAVPSETGGKPGSGSGASEPGAGPGSGKATVPKPQSGNGAGSGDNAYARQLREAAERAEADGQKEVAAKLWERYRNYKKGQE